MRGPATALAGDPPTLSASAFCCAQGQNRTVHTWIFSPLLYQLSYLGSWSAVNNTPDSGYATRGDGDTLMPSGPSGKPFPRKLAVTSFLEE